MDHWVEGSEVPAQKVPEQVYPPKIASKETVMSETKNFFDTNGGGNSAWGPAAGAFLGAMFGENGFGAGNGRQGAVTPDQMGVAINQLQGSIQRDQLQAQVGHSTGVLAGEIAGVKDAVAASSSANSLALCGLGHLVQSGFASQERLALQTALDNERAKATEYRIALSESKNDAKHSQTQVLLNQIIAGNP